MGSISMKIINIKIEKLVKEKIDNSGPSVQGNAFIIQRLFSLRHKQKKIWRRINIIIVA